MAYSEQELEAAGRQLAEGIRQLNQRIEAVEGRPAVDSATQQWNEGRQVAVDQGYSGQELERLEQFMVSRGVSHHVDAIFLDPGRPTGSAKILGGLQQDELDQLLSGDTEGFLQKSLSRLKGEG